MSNRQVAKNAVYLYLRTIVTTIVGIYTSRVVLQTLGIEDYGLYNVVGGVVGLFGFINGAMSGSTSRFITFELGKGDKQRLHDTFNSAMIVHLIISGIVLILAETVGLWFLYNKLVIPEGRMWAAQWVYQLSIISALLGVTQVPYDAVLIAHERFDVSAYISMFSTFAKLGVLYLVAYLPYDNLVSYAILILLITVLTRMFARFYCAKHFEESKFRWIVNKELLKPMLSFSGWEMFGSVGRVAKAQGTNVLSNMYYGVILNAAMGIGNTLSGAVNGLSYNIILAFRPSITKKYAMNDFKGFESDVLKAAFFSFILFNTFSAPMILECPYILKLWLGNVPIFTDVICRINLVFANILMLNIVLSMALDSIGKNKKKNLYPSIVNLFTIVVVYVCYEMEIPLKYIFVLMNISVVYIFFLQLILYARYTKKMQSLKYLLQELLLILCFIMQIFVLGFVQKYFEASLFRLVVLSSSSVCYMILIVFLSPYRKMVFDILKRR